MIDVVALENDWEEATLNTQYMAGETLLVALNTEHRLLAEIRRYAIDMVKADNMSEYRDHYGYRHGTAILSIIDQKPKGNWDSRLECWAEYKDGERIDEGWKRYIGKGAPWPA